MLARRLTSSLSGLTAVARAGVTRAPYPANSVPATQRFVSTNFPANTFMPPPVDADAEIQRIGQHGPVTNKDIKESTVELSTGFGRHRTTMPFKGSVPIISQQCFVAPNATIVGKVVLGDESGVWYGSVIRGDENSVNIGVLSNIYENCLVTADCEVSDISIDTDGTGGRVIELPGVTEIGAFVTVGPGCVMRACTVEDSVIIGANSVICEGSLVESGAVIGAGSVVPPGRRVPSGQLWEGNPIKYVRDITSGEVAEMAQIVRRNLGHLHDHEQNNYPLGEECNMLHKDAQAAISSGK